ncbi:MAG: hypothetical protein GEV11_09455 [Streptosporangiales bacterium]|nr:hypothetical protein [Streptosporangiales bacterium]
MPCYRCGARQSDPVRGASPWKRGVRDDRQVLVCPECQRVHDWTSDLDRCAGCGSTALSCRLGEVECRDCGSVRDQRAAGSAADAATAGLSDEVGAAIARVLRGPRVRE